MLLKQTHKNLPKKSLEKEIQWQILSINMTCSFVQWPYQSQ